MGLAAIFELMACLKRFGVDSDGFEVAWCGLINRQTTVNPRYLDGLEWLAMIKTRIVLLTGQIVGFGAENQAIEAMWYCVFVASTNLHLVHSSPTS
jgi:hypothetical protein